MKKKNGFTLIETMGVLIVLAVILVLAFPNLTKWLKNAEKSIDDATKTLIIEAAKDYVNESEQSIFDDSSYKYCLPLNELVKKGYISTESINKLESSELYVKIFYSNGESSYEIQSECSIESN